MELAGDGSNFGVQQPLDQCVHVFVRRADGRAVGEFVGDAIQSFEQQRFFAGAQNARAPQGVHPCLTREDVLRPETMIDGKTAV